MSGFGDSFVTIHLDSKAAEKELAAFMKRTAGMTPVVPVAADASKITPAINKAVNAAKNVAVINGDARNVTGEVSGAVDNADKTAVIEGDARNVVGAISGAVANTQTVYHVQADAADVVPTINAALANADSVVNVTVNQQGIGEAKTALRDLEETGKKSAGGILQAFSITPGKIATILGGMVVASGVAYNALVQRTTAAFTTLLGSAQAASDKVSEVISFARESPFPRQTFLEATQILIGFGLEADRTTEVLGAIQDAVAAVGGTAPDILEITNILAQVVSSGRLGGEALQQLGSRGIDAAKLIAEQMGTTSGAIKTQISEGTLDARSSLDALVAGMQEAYGGAAANVKATWVGAVDRVKAAVRDLASAIVEPFISVGGGGAAVVFANDLADSLRRLQASIVPLAQSMSTALVPGLSALGKDLLPALVDAFVALAPALGLTTQLLVALGPTISFIAKVIDTIPEPVLAMVGAFLLFQRIGGFLAPLLSGLTNSLLGVVYGAGGATGAITKLVSAITPATALLAVAAVGFGLYAQKQAEAKANAAELAAQQKRLGEAFSDSEGTLAGVTNQLTKMAEQGDDLVFTLGKLGNIDVDLAQALRQAGISAAQFTDELEEGNGVLEDRIEHLFEGSNADKAAALALRELTADYRKEATAAIDSGIATDRWSEAQAKAAIAATRNSDGSKNAVAALALLDEAAREVEAAEKAAADATDQMSEALSAFIANVPQAGRELDSITDGSRDATIGLMGLADQAFRTGASSEAIDAMAASLGVNADRFGGFVEAMGQHLDDLRQDILEGVPPLEDVFRDPELNESPGDYARNVLDAIEMINQQLRDFSPNLDALIPWPNLRDEAARQGPGVAAAYAQVARDGDTALLDETEAGIAEHGQLLFGFTANVNYWAPGFASSTAAAALLGAQSFTDSYNPDLTPGQQRLLESTVASGTALDTVAGALGANAADELELQFNPDGSVGVQNAAATMDANGTAAVDAAGRVGGSSAAAFNASFNVDASRTMTLLAGQMTASQFLLNGTMTVLGSTAAFAFGLAFKPDASGAMRLVESQVSPGSDTAQVIINSARILGSTAAFAFQFAFTPNGTLALNAVAASLQTGSATAGAIVDSARSLGSTADFAFENAFKPDPFFALAAMLSGTEKYVAPMGETGRRTGLLYVQMLIQQLNTANIAVIFPLNDMVMSAEKYVSPMGASGQRAGQLYVSALTSALWAGTSSVAAIVHSYAATLAGGLNPILRAIGQPSITIAADGALLSFARGGLATFRSGGGERHVAQIAPAGAWRVWAEPETGGEAYIPLAQQKRPRSRRIAAETVRRLGGDVMWNAGGNVTGDIVGLNPIFLQRLREWAAALNQTFNVISGYRSVAEQRVLYSRWIAGGKRGAQVAIPGSSMHNYGLAADGPHWRSFGPGRFLLRYPMSFEPWHVEPNEARAWAGMGDTMFFDPLPSPPVIDRTGAVADVARAAMQRVYDQAVQWTMTAFQGLVDTSKLAGSGGNVDIGRRMAAARGWTGALWTALFNLWSKESGWRTTATNPSSGAYGIPQALPGTKMATFGSDWRTNPVTQIGWGDDYIAGRWGNPINAWNHWLRFNWYGRGGISLPKVASFDAGGTLSPGWNVVLNSTGADERLIPVGSGDTRITFVEGAVQVTVTAPVTDRQARVIGRQVGRGINDSLAERRVRVDARLAGGS